ALDTGNAVVGSESFVDKRVIRVQQIEDAAVFTNQTVEEQLHLASERVAEIVIKVRKHVRDGNVAVKRPQAEPLSGEVGGKRGGSRIVEHSVYLLCERRRLGEPFGLGE